MIEIGYALSSEENGRLGHPGDAGGRRLRPQLSTVLSGIILLGLLCSCGVPRDPEGTLERVSGGTLRVGVAETEPWVVIGPQDRPTGVEVTLVEGFAEQLGAEVAWVTGSEAELIAALERRELDIVVAGLTSKTPWSKSVAITTSYYETALVVAVPDEVTPPQDLDGLEVAVEAHTEAAGLVEDKGGHPRRVSQIHSPRGPVAIESYRAESLDLVATDITLAQHRHVMAASPGENAFLVRLERYLRSRRADVSGLLSDFS